jgi:hypothetical protein
MPNVKISSAADAGTLLSSDMLPLARSGDTNAYHATMTEVAAFTNASIASGAYGNVGRNLLHNPLFNVAQRGVGTFGAQGLTLDRWALSFNLDTANVNQSALADTARAQIGDEAADFVLFCGFTGNAGAAAYSRILQRIEGVHRLSGKTVTVSFWVATSGGTLNLGVGLVQNFGTGGSPSSTVVIAGQSVPANTTYTRRSVTFAVPSTSGKTLGTNNDSNTELSFWFSSGTTQAASAGSPGVQSGGIALWGAQLEIGSVATPLEKPDPQQDLAKCQRFYQIVSGSVRVNASGVISMLAGVSFPQMRATPTVTLNTAGSHANVTGVSFSANNSFSGAIGCAAAAAGDAYVLNELYNLSADL